MIFKALRTGIVALIKALPDAMRDCVGIAGAALVAYGAWSIYPPAGYMVAGALMLAGALLGSKD